MIKKTKTMPFAKAYDFLRQDKKLKPAEKLVMFEVCRYWPNPYWGTNLTIAQNIGCSERYAEKLIGHLVKEKRIHRGFAHTDKDGKPHTVRVIVPLCFPEKCSKIIKWSTPEQPFGQHTEQQDGKPPNNGTISPEQQSDLLDNKKEMNNKAMPAPLPAIGQASALPIDNEKLSEVKRFSKVFGNGGRQPLSGQELENRQKKLNQQIKALRANEDLKK